VPEEEGLDRVVDDGGRAGNGMSTLSTRMDLKIDNLHAATMRKSQVRAKLYTNDGKRKIDEDTTI